MLQEPGTQQVGREYSGADSHMSAPEPLNHGADKQVTSSLACALLPPHPNSDELDWFLSPACCRDKIGDKGARAEERVCFGSGSEGVKAECEAAGLQSGSRER